MSQSPPPPPYTAEYGKPPPYYEQPPPGHSHQHQGWVPPPPPPTHGVHPSHSGTAAGRSQVITVTTTTPGYVVTTQPQQHVQVLRLGNCPACRIGFLQNEFNICGILCAIIFFPIGLLCCLCMMEKRCSHCNARF